MLETITATIAPDHNQTRLLILQGTNEILRARLAPPTQSHPRAASTLLEGLALWYQRPLSVVLCVDDTLNSPSLDLCDALGFGRRTLHYDVAIAARDRRPSRHRIGGLGDFRELRRFAAGEVIR